MADTDLGDALVDLIRQIVREEIAAAQGTTVAPQNLTALVTHNMTGICGAKSEHGLRVCQKPPHRGRHLYTIVAAPKPDNGWRDVESFRQKGSGSKSYEIKVGNPVKIKGFGRNGAAQPGWYVTRIQQRGDDINVYARKDRVGTERIVKSHKVIYMRPKKVS